MESVASVFRLTEQPLDSCCALRLKTGAGGVIHLLSGPACSVYLGRLVSHSRRTSAALSRRGQSGRGPGAPPPPTIVIVMAPGRVDVR